MTLSLHYGQDEAVEIDIPTNQQVSTTRGRPVDPIDDVAEHTTRALDDPHNYPPLARAVVPGDQVVVALDDTVPRSGDVVRGTIESLVAAEIQPADIRLLCSADATSIEVDRWLPTELVAAVQVVRHDPADERQLSPLGTTKQGRSVYLNRALCEADVVIPVGCLRMPEVLGTFGVFDSIFPRFADAETVRRYRASIGFESAVHRQGRRQETSEVGWLLGVGMIVSVVPGRSGTVAGIFAGDASAVEQAAGNMCSELWRVQVDRRASLVIATLSGGPAQQTWDNVARALASAALISDDHGAVAICCELDQRPGPSISKLRYAAIDDALIHDLQRDRSADSLAALQLVRSLQRGPVYLMSPLEDEVIEDLGIAPIVSLDELTRLAGRHAACVVLDDAQFASPYVVGEETDRESDQ